MLRQRNAKIAATLGPASSSYEIIKELFLAGVDVFRLNFSHGLQKEHKQNLEHIRNIEREFGYSIGIMADLQGPKLRIGTFSEAVFLGVGKTFVLDLNPEPGNAERVYFPHADIYPAIIKDTLLLLDDGRFTLRVIDNHGDSLQTEVIVGGKLSDRKGVNIPNVALPLSPLTDKDRNDLAFALAMEVDWIALSFVQKPEDIIEAQGLIQNRAKILAKIEKPMALQYLDEIVDLCDGIMVARGDLGVEMPPEDVPIMQKRIIQSCRRRGCPVLVATQMLDSMVLNPTPSRAEASDVANAIYEGADAVMLSAESASGNYPIEAVKMMSRIISRVENDELYETMLASNRQAPESTTAEAITAAAREIAQVLDIKAIVVFTDSGCSALKAAKERPASKLIAMTPNYSIARGLSMVWGVHTIICPNFSTFDAMVEWAASQLRGKEQDRIVIIAGVPAGNSGTTNLLRVVEI